MILNDAALNGAVLNGSAGGATIHSLQAVLAVSSTAIGQVSLVHSLAAVIAASGAVPAPRVTFQHSLQAVLAASATVPSPTVSLVHELAVALSAGSTTTGDLQMAMGLQALLTATGTVTTRLDLLQTLKALLSAQGALALNGLTGLHALQAVLSASSSMSPRVWSTFPVGSFTANVLAQMQTLTGTRPVTILYCAFQTGDLFIGDYDFTVTDWGGADQTVRGWAKKFGKLDDVAGINLADTPILAGDAQAEIVIPGGREASDTLWAALNDRANSPEQTKVSVYVWWRDLDALTDPPVKIWEGCFRDWRWTDEQTLEIELGDAFDRVDRPVGLPVTLANWPKADPDDVSKMENVVYGFVQSIPCLAVDAGANSALSFDLTDSATVLYYSNSAAPFLSSGSVYVDSEEISYTGKTTETLTGVVHGKLTGLTRGANGSTAAAHNKGVALVQVQASYKYLVAGHPMKSVSKVYVNDATGMPVLQPGANYSVNLADVSGADGLTRTMITFTVLPKLTKQINVQVVDTIGVNDAIGVSDTINGTINASADLGLQNTTTSLSQSFLVTNSGGADSDKLTLNFSAPSGSPTKYAYAVGITVTGSVNNGAYVYAKHSSEKVVIATFLNGVWSTNGSFFLGTVSNSLVIGINTTIANGSVVISTCSRQVTGQGTFTKTGAASKTGAATKTGTVSVVGNSAADTVIGGLVTCEGEGYADDASGTYTGTPNALIQLSRDVIRHFLMTYCALETRDVVYSTNLAVKMGSTYTLNGVIQEPTSARRVAARMAFESGCWLKFQAGVAKLTFREATYSAGKLVTTHDLVFLQPGRQTVSTQRVPTDWIINQLDIRYKRDWGQSRSTSAYQACTRVENLSSQTRFGIKARPDLFMCDFVTTDAHATALSGLYLALYSERREVVQFRTRLQHLNIAYGDKVRLQDRMAPRLTGEILSADFTPGNAAALQMPTLDFTLLSIMEAETMLSVVSKTASYTLISPADQWTIFDNQGATGQIGFTLPAATKGMRFIVSVHDAFEVRLIPNGTDLFVLDFTSGSATDKTAPTAQAVGKYLSCSAVRAMLMVICKKSGEWTTFYRVGGWTIQP
ncbi:hypothetical protein [Nitrospira sp. Nam74]